MESLRTFVRSRPFVLPAALLAGLAVASSGCGGRSLQTSAGDGPISRVSGSPASDDAGTSYLFAPGCPSTQPDPGSPCSGVHSCEYGDLTCPALAECNVTVLTPSHQDAWIVSGSGTCSPNSAACPASFGALAAGSPCYGLGLDICTYPEGRCECSGCTLDGGLGDQWACEPWPAPAGCPADRPRMGTACDASLEGVSCAYGSTLCSPEVYFGSDMSCADGVWSVIPTESPCSTDQPTCPNPSDLLPPQPSQPTGDVAKR